jgi:3-oxoacyl-[acyl-carrier-protein] synthase III
MDGILFFVKGKYRKVAAIAVVIVGKGVIVVDHIIAVVFGAAAGAMVMEAKAVATASFVMFGFATTSFAVILT